METIRALVAEAEKQRAAVKRLMSELQAEQPEFQHLFQLATETRTLVIAIRKDIAQMLLEMASAMNIHQVGGAVLHLDRPEYTLLLHPQCIESVQKTVTVEGLANDSYWECVVGNLITDIRNEVLHVGTMQTEVARELGRILELQKQLQGIREVKLGPSAEPSRSS